MYLEGEVKRLEHLIMLARSLEEGSLKMESIKIIGKLKQELFYFISDNSSQAEECLSKGNEYYPYFEFYNLIIEMRRRLFDQELKSLDTLDILMVYFNNLKKMLSHKCTISINRGLSTGKEYVQL